MYIQKYENVCVTKFSRYLFSARSVWNVLLHKYAFWYVARLCSYLHSEYVSLKLSGILPSGCERHRIQNFFQFIDQSSGPSLSLDAVDIGVAVIDPAISEAIKSTVDSSIGLLSDNLTEVIESRLGSFAQCFSEENGITVEQAVKEAHCENSTCQRKGN